MGHMACTFSPLIHRQSDYQQTRFWDHPNWTGSNYVFHFVLKLSRMNIDSLSYLFLKTREKAGRFNGIKRVFFLPKWIIFAWSNLCWATQGQNSFPFQSKCIKKIRKVSIVRDVRDLRESAVDHYDSEKMQTILLESRYMPPLYLALTDDLIMVVTTCYTWI